MAMRYNSTMKRLLFGFLVIAAMIFAQSTVAQTVHNDTLTWTDPSNPAGTTYNVYQASGLCSGNPTFTQVATAITAKTYLVTPLAPGTYCWYVTAALGGAESKPSPTTQAVIGPFAPTSLSNVPQ